MTPLNSAQPHPSHLPLRVTLFESFIVEVAFPLISGIGIVFSASYCYSLYAISFYSISNIALVYADAYGSYLIIYACFMCIKKLFISFG